MHDKKDETAKFQINDNTSDLKHYNSVLLQDSHETVLLCLVLSFRFILNKT